jgi:hypothetical protein
MYGNLEQIVNLTLSESLSLGRSINLTNRLNPEENNNSYSPSNTTGESSFYSSSPSSSASSLLSPSSSFSSSSTSPSPSSTSPNPSSTTSPFLNSILIQPTFSTTISSPINSFSSPFNYQIGSHSSNVAIDSYDGNCYKDLAARTIAFYMGFYNIKIEDEVLDYLVNLILSSVAYTTRNGENSSNNNNTFMLNFQIFYWKLMELFNYENRNARGHF